MTNIKNPAIKPTTIAINRIDRIPIKYPYLNVSRVRIQVRGTKINITIKANIQIDNF